MSPGIGFALVLCLKATIVLALAAAVQVAGGARISAAGRHLVWTLSVLALLVLPAMVPLLPGWSVPASIGSTRERAPSRPALEGRASASAGTSPSGAATSAGPVRLDEPTGGGAVERSSPSPLPRALLLLYLLGAGVMFSRLAAERVTVRRFERGARPNRDPRWAGLLVTVAAEMGVSRPFRMLRSAEAVGPLTWGALSPTILIPDSADAWADDRRRAVLLHELAHVQRWDCLTQTLAALATAMYWFHPGVWWAARRLRIERELACDDLVLAAGAPAHDYAGHLLEIARASRHPPLRAAALSLAGPSRLESRMRAILDRARNRSAPRRRTVVAAAAVASALVVALAGAEAMGSRTVLHQSLRPQAPVALVEELRFGGPGPDHGFQRVHHIAVGRDGAIFVADQPDHARLRMYDAQGRFVRTIGGHGEGPGQYRHVGGLVVTPSGELALYDVFNGRISIYDARGSFLRSMPSRVPKWMGPGRDFQVDEAGNFYVYGLRSTTEVPENPAGQPPVMDPPPPNNNFYLKLSPRGEPMDTLDFPLPPAPRRPSFIYMAPEGYMQPFIDEPVVDLGRNGRLVSGYTREYAFDIRTAAGQVRSVRREYTPIPIVGAERARWEAAADFFTRLEPRGASAGVTIPAHKPAFRDIAVADDGRIWVHRYAVATERPVTMPRPSDAAPALTWRDVPTHDVFEPDGDFFGTVILPENTRIVAREGDRFWATHTGPTGEVQIVRYRLD